MKIAIVRAEKEHIPFIAENMRDADKQEIYDMALLKPDEALIKSLELSAFACTGLCDDKPVCMFGVADSSMLFNVGRPWLLGTDEIEKVPVSFLRRNKKVVQQMMDCYGKLENYVSVENIKSIEWLKWLGFKFDEEPKPMGIFNKKFIRFYMEAECS